jgi:hypothetical protein
MSGIRLWWLWLVALLLLVSTAAPAKKKKEIRQVVIKEVTKVEGKIQKPEVWYLLPRSNLNFQGLKLENKLVPKIEESTKKDPF